MKKEKEAIGKMNFMINRPEGAFEYDQQV